METIHSTKETIKICTSLLIEQNLTIGFAESATCGHLTYSFAMANDAGKFLKGGITCYDATIKENLLKVEKQFIKKHTPESAEVTQAIAVQAATLLDADICIGCTGLTCAGGSESVEKPVGTMFIHGVHNRETIFAERIVYSGDQQHIIQRATDRAAHLLLYYLKHKNRYVSQRQAPKNTTDELGVSWP